MTFASLPYLFAFMVAVVLCYFAVPQRLKNSVLLVFSLLFYSWGEPRYVFLMIGTLAFTYGAGLWLEAKRGSRAGSVRLWTAAVVLLGLLAVFKYAAFAVGTVNGLLGTGFPLPRLALPVGISFYTFQALSYLVDVYRGDVPAQRNVITLATYIALFPQLVAGPIVRYSDIAEAMVSRKTTPEDAGAGARRFVLGLGKKMILANLLGELCAAWRAVDDPSVLFAWLYAIGFSLQLYLDFSAYSDMAIGLGRIFGFHFPENFNYPYLARSITDFWRRWHMTLGQWFRDYVYFPLGGSRVSKGKLVRNLLVVWMLTGLWHGAGWNFIIWGLWFGVLLIGEKLLWGGALKKLPAWIQHVYVLLAVIISFVFFNAADMGQAGQDLLAMSGLGGLPLATDSALYALRNYAVVLVLSLSVATPLWRRLGDKVLASRWSVVLEPLALLLILFLCTAELVDGSFNPFLYFRF